MKKVVLTYGTFDLFHIGHVRLLERARALGDFLVVGVSTDEFNALKGKKSVIPFEHRSEIVRAVRYVDLVIPESNWEQKAEDIRGHAVHTFVMGDDWTGKFDHLEEHGIRVVYLPHTLDISSTQINAELPEDQRDHLNQVSDENLTLPQ